MLVKVIFVNYQKQPPEVFYKKGVPRNFTKFIGKYQSLFFNQVKVLRPATLLKKRLRHWCFSLNFARFLRTPFSHNASGQLLLNYKQTGTSIGLHT